MRIGLYHGYELTGSGSNEYTRYLARSLADAGHEVHIICREPHPEVIPYVTCAYAWQKDGEKTTLFRHANKQPACFLHQLPHGVVRPVYLTDKQREGNVKSFVALTDEELAAFHQLNETLLGRILTRCKLDVLHANHLVYQPVAALEPCRATDTPLVIFPHGSAIEYSIRPDSRYQQLALKGILGSSGLIIGNQEVLDRILNLYPQQRNIILQKTRIVGVGVDTSLFKPVARPERYQSIGQLLKKDAKGGKRPELTQQLYQRLENSEIDAVRNYWDSYNHALPDENLNQKLQEIPWDQKILLFVGALTVGKGLYSLLTALPSVLTEHPEVHLVIVGSGAYREVLEALVFAISTANQKLLLQLCSQGYDLDRNEQTGPWEDVQHFLQNPANLSRLLETGNPLDRHVHFLGRLDHSLLCHLFPCADIAIFPSVIPEAYPLVVMESLSNGVLPMVSYFSGFKDSIDDLEAFLDPGLIELIKIPTAHDVRIKTIADNLRQLFSGQYLQHIRPILRRIAVDHFDWKLRASQMTDAYRSLI